MTVMERFKAWLAVGQRRAILIGVSVLALVIAAGVPSLAGGGKSGPASVAVDNQQPVPGLTDPVTTSPSAEASAAASASAAAKSAGGRHKGQTATATASATSRASHAAHVNPANGSDGKRHLTKTSDGKTTIAGGNGKHPVLNGGGDPDKYKNLPMGKGVDASSIKLGIAYDTNAAAYGSAYGVETSSVDQKAQAQGIVDYINNHGGVAGRNLVPVWHAVDLAAGLHGANLGQQTCTAFTQDNTVFGVVSVDTPNDECLAKGDTPIISSNLGTTSADAIKYADYYYGPSSLFDVRSLNAYVAGLNQEGFWNASPSGVGCDTHGNRIGVLMFGLQKDQLKPMVDREMAAIGKSVYDYGYIAGDSSNVQQVVLQFKNDCITHIITPDYSPLLFANAANNQQYYPMWGVTSRQSPNLLAQNVNKDELAKTWVVGWSPLADVNAANDPGPVGPAARLCQQIMVAQGLPSDRLAMASADGLCDSIFVLTVALDNADALTPHGLRGAYEAIGAWDSTTTFKDSLGPNHHDGVAGWRPARYDASTKGFKYTGSVVNLP